MALSHPWSAQSLRGFRPDISVATIAIAIAALLLLLLLDDANFFLPSSDTA